MFFLFCKAKKTKNFYFTWVSMARPTTARTKVKAVLTMPGKLRSTLLPNPKDVAGGAAE